MLTGVYTYRLYTTPVGSSTGGGRGRGAGRHGLAPVGVVCGSSSPLHTGQGGRRCTGRADRAVNPVGLPQPQRRPQRAGSTGRACCGATVRGCGVAALLVWPIDPFVYPCSCPGSGRASGWFPSHLDTG